MSRRQLRSPTIATKKAADGQEPGSEPTSESPETPKKPATRKRRTSTPRKQTKKTPTEAAGTSAEAPAKKSTKSTRAAKSAKTTKSAKASKPAKTTAATKAAKAPKEPQAESSVAVSESGAADEKPKRGRRKLGETSTASSKPKPARAKPKKPKADEPLEQSALAGPDGGEAAGDSVKKKPKRARSTTRKKATKAKEPAATVDATAAAAEGATSEGEPKKKPQRRRKKKAPTATASAVATDSDGAAKGDSKSTSKDQAKTDPKSDPKDEAEGGTKKSSRSSTRRRTKKSGATAKDSDSGTRAKSGDKKKRGRSSSSRKPRAATPKRSDAPAIRKEMVISVDVGEQRVAVIEDDSVVEVYLERRGRGSVAGSVYKGIVDNVLPGMEASFVDIGLERNGFLYVGEIVVPDGEQNGRKQSRRIQDLISRGQEVLVQAVKDPMGTKGARLTTEISLPGRFVVFVPYGEGIGISRRLDDEERDRLKKLCRQLDLPEGGIIVRTAAEGVTEEELRGDLALLRKLWATILGRSNRAEAPTLVYREAELPLRLVRDLFIRDFERMVVDHEPTHRRLVGYLKRTSPELAARVELDAAAESILQRHGVEEAMRSTLGRTVPLPSGGSLVFDYAEALTVIDVNTGRFVGAKGSQTSLEDTITKNNLEAAREVVRQLRLRDIGGIIVIDFIDMSNSKNRKAVEEELSRELARDRTKTYVVEISPLGLVEMTRQNVTDGPREILTVQCPTCTGEGVVISEETMVIDVERALRSRARSSDAEAMLVELNERTARKVIGPGGDRLADFEADVEKRVFVESRTDVPLDYMEILAEGTAAEMELRGLPVSPGDDIELELEDAYLLDPADAIGRLDGYVVVVGGAGRRVGETVRVAVDRVTRTTAYASVVLDGEEGPPIETLTAEAAIGVDGAAGELDDVELVETPKIDRPSEEEEAKEAPASSAELSDGEESVAAKPASKRRRKRRKPAKKPDAEGSEAKENADDGAQVTSESGDGAKAAEAAGQQNATEANGGDAEGPKKPSRRRRRRGSRGRGLKGAGAVKPGDGESDSSSTGAEAASEAARPVPPASEAPGNGSPKRRRRRSTRSGTSTGGPTQNGAASAPQRSGTPQGDAPRSDESDGGTANDSRPANNGTPDGPTDTTGSSEAAPKPANRRRRRSSTSRKAASPKPVESASAAQPDVVASSKPPEEG